MPWEYLDNMNYRYTIAANMVDFTGKHVIDLCAGNAGLYPLVEHKIASYRACDVRKLHPVVEEMKDEDFVKTVDKCDVLCVFGYGGFEMTREPLESPTLLESTKTLMEKFDPIVILECVTKFESLLHPLMKGYCVESFWTSGSDWLSDRVLFVLRREPCPLPANSRPN
jgi:hypothetical protein